jgi:hypothetical protein
MFNSPGHSVTPLIVRTHKYMYGTSDMVPMADGPLSYVDLRH